MSAAMIPEERCSHGSVMSCLWCSRNWRPWLASFAASSSLLRPRQQQREQLRPAFAVDDAVDQVGPEAALEGDHRLLRRRSRHSRSARARAGSRRRSSKGRSGRASGSAARAGAWPAPPTGTARPGSSLRAGATSEWPTTLPRPMPCRSLMSATSGISAAICSSGNGAIAEFVAGIDDLDPDARRIDVGDAAPARLAGVPGALGFVDQAIDRAVLVDADNGPRPWLRARSAGRARPRQSGMPV